MGYEFARLAPNRVDLPRPPCAPRWLNYALRRLGYEIRSLPSGYRFGRLLNSETSFARSRLAHYCSGYGLDLGFGGDKIAPHAIGVDMPQPYTRVGDDPVQLGGDARNLYWFRDGVLDFVYSSHLLEDFEDTVEIMREWVRVLKPGGHLVLYLPDERTYRAYCQKTGHPYNQNHKLDCFGPDHVLNCAQEIGQLEIVHVSGIVNHYSFEVVFRKKLR
jgi:predicted SAM-dependent methyltransferase